MPNRLKKTNLGPSGKEIVRPRLKGFREAISAELDTRGWGVMDLIREIEARGGKLDDDYYRRMMKGQRFNEENIVLISEILGLPVYIGDRPKPEVRVELPPTEGAPKLNGRPDNIPVPVLPADIVIRKPLRYDPRKVADWAYTNWRAFQAFNPDQMVCTKIIQDTPTPFVRKESMICIAVGILPPENNVPEAPIWAARVGKEVVIGHFSEQRGVCMIRQVVPMHHTWVIERDDIIGQVCWLWRSMV